MFLARSLVWLPLIRPIIIVVFQVGGFDFLFVRQLIIIVLPWLSMWGLGKWIYPWWGMHCVGDSWSFYSWRYPGERFFKIEDTTGMLDNIIHCKLYKLGSVGFVSKCISFSFHIARCSSIGHNSLLDYSVQLFVNLTMLPDLIELY